MFYNRNDINCFLSHHWNRLTAAVFTGVLLLPVLAFCRFAYGSQEIEGSGSSDPDQMYAVLLAEEETLRKDFPDGDSQDEEILRFKAVDITGDGQKDLIVSREKADSRQNSDTCFYSVVEGAPCLIGVVKTDSGQRVGYHEDTGYAYLYTEAEDGGQKIELLAFSKKPYDAETGENNCSTYMTFSMTPDEEDELHCYLDEKEVSEKEFLKTFIKYLGKPAPFYEDAYYYGWDGYELAAERENTPETRQEVFGSDGTVIPEVETEAETETATEAETETATEVETEVVTEATIEAATETSTEVVTEVETEAVTEEKEEAATEAAMEAVTEATSEGTEVMADLAVWICPECDSEARGNFCSNCGAVNPSPEWICPGCNETVTGNFCKHCGTARPVIRTSALSDEENGKEETQETVLDEAIDGTNTGEDSYIDSSSPSPEDEYYEGSDDVSENLENDADWDAVHKADLTEGDPVIVPGDLYADGQERYKITGYILPQSATQYLTESDISHLSMKGCCYARNEIYARHGRMFNANELKEYFSSCSWYEGTVPPESFDESYTQSVFNEYEYENAYFLWKYEEEHGMYWPE